MERWIVKSEAGRGSFFVKVNVNESLGVWYGRTRFVGGKGQAGSGKSKKSRVWDQRSKWGGELSHKRNLWIWKAVLKNPIWKETNGESWPHFRKGCPEGIKKFSVVRLTQKQLKAYLIYHKILVFNNLYTRFYPDKKPLAKVRT